jgi:sortase (surface protein transpeptidase)
MLDRQQLLVAVWDPAASATFARRRWDGALLPAERDALLVIDSEVTASKQSQMVSRNVAYSVGLASPDGPHGRITITYTNNSRPDLRPNVFFVEDYRNYLRVYAPAGANLSTSSGFVTDVTTSVECGRTVFGGEVLIPRGKSVEVVLDYRLPPSVVRDGGYELVVQQQPGVPRGTLAVSVVSPDGSKASTLRDNAVGHHYRFQLGPSELVDAPLEGAQSGGCAMPLVTAAPIAAPTWLEIPSAQISAPIVDLGVDANGMMEAPATPDVVGWYRMSARAGQPGNSVLSGHVDWGTNTAVVWGLRELAPMDSIVLKGADGGQHQYVVQWNRVYSRDDPVLASFVRGVPGAALTLITCEGVYDRSARDYSDRRIVRASLSE